MPEYDSRGFGFTPSPAYGRYDGGTWWIGRWAAAVRGWDQSNRMGRWWNQTRRLQVLGLTVEPGRVVARVQEGWNETREVEVRLKVLSDEKWEQIADQLAAQAAHGARLLGGALPEELPEMFAAAGAPLFPTTEDDLEVTCSCPDPFAPCKHAAAVLTRLGQGIDMDPFLLLALRGRTKEQLLAALRARRVPASTPTADAAEDEYPPQDPAGVLAADPAAFWRAGPGLEDLRLSFVPPASDALPVKQLGPPPFWYDRRSFTTLMERAYRAVAVHALEKVKAVKPEG